MLGSRPPKGELQEYLSDKETAPSGIDFYLSIKQIEIV